MDYSKFNDCIDMTTLEEEIKNAQTGKTEYVEVPDDTYEVRIEKLELGESKAGKPMLKVWFKIIVGEYKNSMMFMNQTIDKGFGLHKAFEFLRSLGTDVSVDMKVSDFKSIGEFYEAVDNACMDIKEKIDTDGIEYAVECKTVKGFKNFEVKQVFKE